MSLYRAAFNFLPLQILHCNGNYAYRIKYFQIMIFSSCTRAVLSFYLPNIVFANHVVFAFTNHSLFDLFQTRVADLARAIECLCLNRPKQWCARCRANSNKLFYTARLRRGW